MRMNSAFGPLLAALLAAVGAAALLLLWRRAFGRAPMHKPGRVPASDLARDDDGSASSASTAAGPHNSHLQLVEKEPVHPAGASVPSPGAAKEKAEQRL